MKGLLASRRLPVAWLVASAILLVAAAYIDPYILGLAAFIAAGISGLLVLGVLLANWRSLPWALLAAAPTALAFLRLSTYKWA